MEASPTRSAILDAAEALLVSRGFKGMTIDAVAEAAQIGKGTVYLSFTSKTELAVGVIQRREELVLAQLSHDNDVESFLVDRVMLRYDAYEDLPAGVEASIGGALNEWRTARAELLSREEGLLHQENAEAMLIATEALLPFSFSYETLGPRSLVLQRARAVSKALARPKAVLNSDESLLEKLERLHY